MPSPEPESPDDVPRSSARTADDLRIAQAPRDAGVGTPQLDAGVRGDAGLTDAGSPGGPGTPPDAGARGIGDAGAPLRPGAPPTTPGPGSGPLPPGSPTPPGPGSAPPPPPSTPPPASPPGTPPTPATPR